MDSAANSRWNTSQDLVFGQVSAIAASIPRVSVFFHFLILLQNVRYSFTGDVHWTSDLTLIQFRILLHQFMNFIDLSSVLGSTGLTEGLVLRCCYGPSENLEITYKLF